MRWVIERKELMPVTVEADGFKLVGGWLFAWKQEPGFFGGRQNVAGFDAKTVSAVLPEEELKPV